MCKRVTLLVGALAAGVAFADEPRDPTQPSGHVQSGPKVAASRKAPTLSSVLIGADRRLATVDGNLMSEGEEHSGVKVWEIKSDRVVVSVAGQKPVTLLLDTGRIHKELR